MNKFADWHPILFSIAVFAAYSIIVPMPFVIVVKVFRFELEPFA